MGLDDLWLVKTLTQISVHWYSWHTWLISMHCSQKTFQFLSVSNSLTSILSDIVIARWKSHETLFAGYFWKITNTCKRCFWDISGTSPKRHFLRGIWDVLKTSQKAHVFWNVSKRSLRCLFQWRSNWRAQSHAGWDVLFLFSFFHFDGRINYYLQI